MPKVTLTLNSLCGTFMPQTWVGIARGGVACRHTGHPPDQMVSLISTNISRQIAHREALYGRFFTRH